MNKKMFRALTWSGIALTLSLVFHQYLQPEFLLEMANQAALCA